MKLWTKTHKLSTVPLHRLCSLFISGLSTAFPTRFLALQNLQENVHVVVEVVISGTQFVDGAYGMQNGRMITATEGITDRGIAL
jgi:hypothetical protein